MQSEAGEAQAEEEAQDVGERIQPEGAEVQPVGRVVHTEGEEEDEDAQSEGEEKHGKQTAQGAQAEGGEVNRHDAGCEPLSSGMGCPAARRNPEELAVKRVTRPGEVHHSKWKCKHWGGRLRKTCAGGEECKSAC